MKKTKKMLVDKIKRTGYEIRGYISKDELERIAKTKNIEFTYEYLVKKEGWMGKPKGLLQVLWERGFIDQGNIVLYLLKGTPTLPMKSRQWSTSSCNFQGKRNK